MKKILSLVLVMNISATAFAGVREDVKALSKLAFGFEEHKVAGDNASEILENYFDGEELVYKEYAEMEYSDEVDQGLTSKKSAIEMASLAQTTIDEMITNLSDMGDEENKIPDLKAQHYDLDTKWKSAIEKLARLGVKFGYSGSGPGYCGISFVELIVIDEKQNKMYEIYLSEGGDC